MGYMPLGDRAFGNELLQFRARHYLTQQRLAELLGISLGMVHRYETNAAKPSKRNLIIYRNTMSYYDELNKQD